MPHSSAITSKLSAKEIGVRVKFCRNRHKITRSELGMQALGKPSKNSANSYLQRVENGEHMTLKESDVQRIIQYLGMSSDEFLGMKTATSVDHTLSHLHHAVPDHLDAICIAHRLGNNTILKASVSAFRDLLNDVLETME